MTIKFIDKGNGYSELIAEFPFLIDFQVAYLGRQDRLVPTGQQHIYYARLLNGRIVTVINIVEVPPIFDLRVIVGKEKTISGKFHVIGIWDNV